MSQGKTSDGSYIRISRRKRRNVCIRYRREQRFNWNRIITNSGWKKTVIAYASRTFSSAEKNYCVTRKEMLALVYFVKHFKQYLLGREFLPRTDHGSLVWLHKFKEPDGQIARWIQQLGPYNFQIEHRPGKRHGNADALSRINSKETVNCKQCKMDVTISDDSEEKCSKTVKTYGKCALLVVIHMRMKTAIL